MRHKFDWQLLQSNYILKDKWISVRAGSCRVRLGYLTVDEAEHG